MNKKNAEIAVNLNYILIFMFIISFLKDFLILSMLFWIASGAVAIQMWNPDTFLEHHGKTRKKALPVYLAAGLIGLSMTVIIYFIDYYESDDG